MGNVKRRDIERAARVLKTARIRGVSKREVNYVLEGKRKNQEVHDTYMKLYEGEKELEVNLLLEAVKDLIPL